MIDKIIVLKQAKSHDIGNQILCVFDSVEKMNSLNDPCNLTVDISAWNFLSPFVYLPISAYLLDLENRGFVVKIIFPSNSSYLKTILFYKGMPLNNNWKEILDDFALKTYVPITIIPVEGEIDSKQRESLMTLIEQIFFMNSVLSVKFKTPINYMIAEMVDNIVNHAKANKGYIMLQSYPTKGYIDICIVDRGMSVLGSYLNNSKFTNVLSHKDAMQEAINGSSTKDLPDNESRGYGISTTKHMLVDGLKGYYYLYSGNAFYVRDYRNDNILELQEEKAWRGTIVFLRVPNVIPNNFDFYSYTE